MFLRSRVVPVGIAMAFLLLGIAGQSKTSTSAGKQILRRPTFYRDVMPILQDHCQVCHRKGEIAPMPFVTYEQTRSWAAAIKRAVQSKQMPPWFADPRYGRFSNDPSLTPQQISVVAAWVDAGAPAGSPRDAPPSRNWVEGWNIPEPDKVVQMPQAVSLPAIGDVEYTYEIVPTGFTEDKWVQMSEIRPSSREHVHHAVVYIRPPPSKWLRNAPVGGPFTPSSFSDAEERAEAHATTSDMLLVYAPGSEPDRWPDGMAKFVPAGSDLVFQMHYTTNGHATSDQTSIGLVFAKQPPKQRVLTLQLTNHSFVIPPERTIIAWTSQAPCRTMQLYSASFPTCTCAVSGSSTTSVTPRERSRPCCG